MRDQALHLRPRPLPSARRTETSRVAVVRGNSTSPLLMSLLLQLSRERSSSLTSFCDRRKKRSRELEDPPRFNAKAQRRQDAENEKQSRRVPPRKAQFDNSLEERNSITLL